MEESIGVSHMLEGSLQPVPGREVQRSLGEGELCTRLTTGLTTADNSHRPEETGSVRRERDRTKEASQVMWGKCWGRYVSATGGGLSKSATGCQLFLAPPPVAELSVSKVLPR